MIFSVTPRCRFEHLIQLTIPNFVQEVTKLLRISQLVESVCTNHSGSKVASFSVSDLSRKIFFSPKIVKGRSVLGSTVPVGRARTYIVYDEHTSYPYGGVSSV